MDLAKAKSITIILLVAFNIFLLANNLAGIGGNRVRKETIESTIMILKQRGVTLDCNIPVTSLGVHKLEYKNGRLDRIELAGKLLGEQLELSGREDVLESGGKKLTFLSDTKFLFESGQKGVPPASRLELGSDEKVEKAAREFLNKNGLLTGRYVVDEMIRNHDGSVTVVLIENYEGLLLYDNYCSVTMNENGVSRLEYSKQQVNGFDAKRIERFEAYQALLSRFKAGSGEGIIITGIDNGYKLDEISMDGMESTELLPVWRVKLKGEAEPVYIGSQETNE